MNKVILLAIGLIIVLIACSGVYAYSNLNKTIEQTNNPSPTITPTSEPALSSI